MINAQTLHRRAVRVLPEVIQTSGVLLPDAGQRQIAALLFPLRRKSSGSLVFRISTQTLEKLSSDPAGYLTQATRAREGTSRHAKRFAYKPWRRAVIPLGAVYGNGRYPRSIPATHVEAYFTAKTDGKALLVLIPEERLLVYIWND